MIEVTTEISDNVFRVCSYCKRHINDAGEWEGVLGLFQTVPEEKMLYGKCPECLKKYFPTVYSSLFDNETVFKQNPLSHDNKFHEFFLLSVTLGAFSVNMTANKGLDMFENIPEKACKTCKNILLFQEVTIDEEEVRLFLYCNSVSNDKLQDAFIGLVRGHGDRS